MQNSRGVVLGIDCSETRDTKKLGAFVPWW